MQGQENTNSMSDRARVADNAVVRRVGLLIVINLVVRGLWVWYMHPVQTSDFAHYYHHAVQLYEGLGFLNYGHISAFWPIGYPMFLSLLFHLTGPSVIAGLIVQILLSTGTVVLIYLLALAIGARQWTAMAAAVGYTVLPTQIAWNSLLGTEELCMFLIILSLYLYIQFSRRHIVWLALSGISLGLACDVREVVAFYPAFLLIAELVLNRRDWRQILLRVIIFTVCMYLAVSPVTIRNAFAMHHFILVSLNGGQNLWQGLHTNGGYYWSNNPAVNPLLQAGSNEVLADRIGKTAFLHFVLQHPLRAVLNGFIKMFDLYRYDQTVYYFFHVDDITGWSGLPYQIICAVSTWFYRLWMIPALVGLVSLFAKRVSVVTWRQAAIPLSYIIYNTCLMSVFPAWDRFRMPMMPEWAVFFGLGATVLVATVQSRRRQREYKPAQAAYRH